MTTKEIFDANNHLLKQKVIDKVKELPKVNINPATVHDFAFTQPIVELTEKENTNFKNLINGDN